MTTPPSLPFDVLSCIYEFLHGEYKTLAASCLVNWQVNQAASSILYRDMVFNFGWPLEPDFAIHDFLPIPQESVLESASLPHNCQYVKSVVLQGVEMNVIPVKIVTEALKSFTNLKSIVFDVGRVEPGFFPASSQILAERGSSLHTIQIRIPWGVGFVQDHLDRMINPHNLRKLAIVGIKKDNAIMLRLNSYDEKALPNLHELCLQTASYIRLVPLRLGIKAAFGRNLRVLSLGVFASKLSHDQELFLSLSQMPSLEDLCLIYHSWHWSNYTQTDVTPSRRLNPKPAFAPLYQLKSFTLRYSSACEPHEHIEKGVALFLSCALTSSPVERLSFRPFYQPRTINPIPKRSWDGLIDHLVDKHSGTLKFLDLGAVYVKKAAMKRVLERCSLLEEFFVGTCRSSIFLLPQYAAKLPRLHKVRFELRTLKGRGYGAFSTEDASVILNGVSPLRRLKVNDDEWEGSWTLTAIGELSYDTVLLARRPKDLWAPLQLR
uniref:F-box domain-containing protein n=1 Tax=Moniliophthora roreri TaxID=221103 RepID=A0A0W0FNA7_MONRR